ncbi:MAG: hypothetical protein ACRYGK_03205 [Janthinobacterium lividum]
MISIPNILPNKLCLASAALVLMACSPTFNWREVHGTAVPYTVLLPAKPASFTRQVNLDGQPVMMEMTAAKVGEVSFAVGSASLPDAAAAAKALTAMQKAMVRNIQGAQLEQHPLASRAGNPAGREIEASGTSSSGQPVRLLARFIVRGNRVWQVVVLGATGNWPGEAAGVFLDSFKPEG